MSIALQQTALRLIERNGTSVTFVRTVEGEHDDVLGYAPTATVRTTVKAVLGDVSMSSGEVDEPGSMETMRKQLMIAGLALDDMPRPGDAVEFDDATWRVVSCNKVNPDGLTYIYTVVVKR